MAFATTVDKETFLKGIAPLCQNLAVENFMEAHHREPKPQEAEHLEKQYEEAASDFLQSKVARFQQASRLLIEFLPQLFSHQESELVLSDFKNIQEQLNIATESLSKCFEVGKHLFQNHRFEEAGDVFEMLVFLNPKFTTAWLDLGLSLHEQGKLREALKAYAATYFLDSKPLYARMKSIEVYLALQQKNDAMAEFDELEQLVYTNPDPTWKETLKLLAKKIGEAK